MKNSRQLDGLVSPVIEALIEYFSDLDPSEVDTTKARIGNSVLSTWAKLVQSERAQAGLYWSMAQVLAKDPEELRRYVELSMPDMPLLETAQEPANKE